MSTKTKRPRFFAALPTEAISDDRLTALELRALAVIAWHDGLSGTSQGKAGGGCFAAHRTLARELGTDVTNFSKALNRLKAFGYVTSTPQIIDKRRMTLRVTYDETAKEVGELTNNNPKLVGELTNNLPELVGELTNYNAKVVGDEECKIGSFSKENAMHYSPIIGELNSEESEKETPLNGASLSRRVIINSDDELCRRLVDLPWQAQLVVIEREVLKGDSYFKYNPISWQEYVTGILDNCDDNAIRGHAERIIDELENAIPF